MNLQTVEIEGKTYALIQDGKPLYKGDDGKDVAFDAPGTVATISRLNGEAKGHRERAEKAETTLKTFEGLDAAGARDAIDKLSKIDAKKLVEAGDMDAAIQTALKPVQDQLAAATDLNKTLTSTLHSEKIGNHFGQSKFVTEKLTPAGADLVRTLYGDRLKVEDNKIVGYDPNGQKLYSKARPGELADFDEIVETCVESYPHKDHILRSAMGSGGGASNSGGGSSGSKTIPRAQWDTMPHGDRAAKVKDGFTVVD